MLADGQARPGDWLFVNPNAQASIRLVMVMVTPGMVVVPVMMMRNNVDDGRRQDVMVVMVTMAPHMTVAMMVMMVLHGLEEAVFGDKRSRRQRRGLRGTRGNGETQRERASTKPGEQSFHLVYAS